MCWAWLAASDGTMPVTVQCLLLLYSELLCRQQNSLGVELGLQPVTGNSNNSNNLLLLQCLILLCSVTELNNWHLWEFSWIHLQRSHRLALSAFLKEGGSDSLKFHPFACRIHDVWVLIAG